jgi:GH24 family phage-related lysozyme (muramidase)
MNLIAARLTLRRRLKAEAKAHAVWVAQVNESSILRGKLKHAHPDEVDYLTAQLTHSINTAKTDHGIWESALDLVERVKANIQAEEQKRGSTATSCSLALAKAVAQWEGGQSADGLFHSYQDSVGVWTVGYGHTAADGAPIPGPGLRPLTRAEATTLLLHDLNSYYAPAVNQAVKAAHWMLTQKQFDALTSFCYNLGAGYFSPNHDIGWAIRQHEVHQIAQYMLNYDHAGGVVLAGLQHRRQWESQLFLGGTYTI